MSVIGCEGNPCIVFLFYLLTKSFAVVIRSFLLIFYIVIVKVRIRAVLSFTANMAFLSLTKVHSHMIWNVILTLLQLLWTVLNYRFYRHQIHFLKCYDSFLKFSWSEYLQKIWYHSETCNYMISLIRHKGIKLVEWNGHFNK